MTGLSLTTERRNELAALLDDDVRLRTEYPQVADYLDTAPRLRGAGDDAADAAFDLRFVHFMTGGESANPYWDIVRPSVVGRVVSGGSARLAYAQTILQAVYAYAVPSPETLRWLEHFAQGRPVLELGASNGYWAAQLARLGVNVTAFDSAPPDTSENVSFPGAHVWQQIGSLDEYAPQPESVLFLCWPPGWGDPMASRALRGFEEAGGERLVFIGEPKGGKTGDDAFFDRLTAAWTLESQDPDHVSWWNLADDAQGWVRR
ncbi:hypothetical protein DFR70_110179 [Nocardia tenerifensis]|uniref:Methyltransferase family protein n=1 Tax=Nocardia tenerifensis TaxID=228006 RepID=A0A318JVU2_9NOCA|nr:hypothetical protein [Nocardia tenerifensis]PXX60339.1 hypothetical protein DFR70_110179 [Nocardia tenerifensis]